MERETMASRESKDGGETPNPPILHSVIRPCPKVSILESPNPSISVDKAQQNLSTVFDHLKNERLVYNRLILASIRGTAATALTTTHDVQASLQKLRRINFLIVVEERKRYQNSRKLRPPVGIRSVMALNHNANSTVVKRHQQWEGSDSRYNLLLSLRTKLQLKLIFEILRQHWKYRKTSRQMCSNVPYLRQKKLAQLCFIALLVDATSSRYKTIRSEALVDQFLLKTRIRGSFLRLRRLSYWRRRSRHSHYFAIHYNDRKLMSIGLQPWLDIARKMALKRLAGMLFNRRHLMRSLLAWRYSYLHKLHFRAQLHHQLSSSTLSTIDRASFISAKSSAPPVSSADYHRRLHQSVLEQLSFARLHLSRSQQQAPTDQTASSFHQTLLNQSQLSIDSLQYGQSDKRRSAGPIQSAREKQSYAQPHSRPSLLIPSPASASSSFSMSSKDQPVVLFSPSSASWLSPRPLGRSLPRTLTARSSQSSILSRSHLSTKRPQSLLDQILELTMEELSTADTQSALQTPAATERDPSSISRVSAPTTTTNQFNHQSSRTSYTHASSFHSQPSRATSSSQSSPDSSISSVSLQGLPLHVGDDHEDVLGQLRRREPVMQFMRQRITKWFLRETTGFLRHLRRMCHLRRSMSRLRLIAQNRLRRQRWQQWRRAFFQWTQQGQLCDQIADIRLMRRIWRPWSEGFQRRNHLHHLLTEHIAFLKTKRCLRRHLRLWEALFRRRVSEDWCTAQVRRLRLRSLFSAWQLVRHRRQAVQTRLIRWRRRQLRPLFDCWLEKFQRRRLLRRVFRLREIAWHQRRHDQSLYQSELAEQYRAETHFHLLHRIVIGWRDYVHYRRQQRQEAQQLHMALCFRGSTLLARWFCVWQEQVGLLKRLKRWRQKCLYRLLRRVWSAWKTWQESPAPLSRTTLQQKQLTKKQRVRHWRLTRVFRAWAKQSIHRYQSVIRRVERRQELHTLYRALKHWILAVHTHRSQDREKKRTQTLMTVDDADQENISPNSVVHKEHDFLHHAPEKVGRILREKKALVGNEQDSDDDDELVQIIRERLKERRKVVKSRRQTNDTEDVLTTIEHSQQVHSHQNNIVLRDSFSRWHRLWSFIRRLQRGGKLLLRAVLRHFFTSWPGREQILAATAIRVRILSRDSSQRVHLVDIPDDEGSSRAREETMSMASDYTTMSTARRSEQLRAQLDDLQSRALQLSPRHRIFRPHAGKHKRRTIKRVVASTLSELIERAGFIVEGKTATQTLSYWHETLKILLQCWRRYIEKQKALRLRGVEVRNSCRQRLLRETLRQWIASTPRTAHRLITWLTHPYY